jgi:four helix bundle protein
MVTMNASPDLLDRTRQFALRVIAVFRALPHDDAARVLGKQMLRSGTSVGAQYREAQRAKSDADFISKIEGSLQELEETRYWLELLSESGLLPATASRPCTKKPPSSLLSS